MIRFACSPLLLQSVQAYQINLEGVIPASLRLEGFYLGKERTHELDQLDLASSLKNLDHQIPVNLQMILCQIYNLLGKVFTACRIHGPVAHRHRGCITDDDIVGSVGYELLSHLFPKGIPDVGCDSRWYRIEVQGSEVDCNNRTLALDQLIMGIKRPRSWSRPHIQNSITAFDKLEILLQLLELVDGAGGVAFLVCTFGIGVCTVSSAGCHA
jgi:hypothetical protein